MLHKDVSVIGAFFHSCPGDSILPSMIADGQALKNRQSELSA